MNWTVLTPLLVAVLGYVLVLARKWLLTHVAPGSLGALDGLARQAVAAADQVAKATGIKGADKFTVASDALIAGAKRLGIRLKKEEVISFIHAALADFKAAEAYAQSLGGTPPVVD